MWKRKLCDDRKRHSKLRTAEIQFLRSVKGSTRLDKTRNEDGSVRDELRAFSVNVRIRWCRQDWVEHGTKMKAGRVPKLALWYRSWYSMRKVEFMEAGKGPSA
jgi:hypothetical protein